MIKTKAQERKLNIGIHRGEYRYILSPEYYAPLKEKKVVEEAALRCGLSAGVVRMAYEAIAHVIAAWVTEGHSIPLPGLGSLRFGMRTRSVANAEDVKTDLIKMRRLVLVPNQDIREKLANTQIQITVVDRDGNIIKRVTNSSGEVDPDETDSEQTEDPESPDTGGEETPDTDDTGNTDDTQTPGDGEDIGGGI